MRVKSPTITLLTGAGLGIVLLVASMLATAHAAAPSAPAPARSPAHTEDAGSPQASPSLTSSAPAKARTRATYVALVHGGGAAVAISVSGGRASAYVCKGSVVEARLSGAAAAGNLTLTGRDHAQLRATYNLRKAVGYVLANGVRYTFSAPALRKSSAEHESIRSRCEGESRVGTGAGQAGGHDGGGHGGGGGGGHGGGGGGD
jgi:serine/threonine-protein kinase